MTHTARMRTNLFMLITIGVLSAGIMLWMFWHFPLSTAIATVVVLSAFGISARLASWVDGAESRSDLEHGEQGA